MAVCGHQHAHTPSPVEQGYGNDLADARLTQALGKRIASLGDVDRHGLGVLDDLHPVAVAGSRRKLVE